MRKIACFTLLLASFVPQAWAADDLMSSQLVDEARQWQQKDRDDIAAGVWRKLLRTTPKHPEALVKLGLIEARAGNLKEAQALLSRASQLGVPPPGLSELSAALRAVEGPPKNTPPPTPEQSKAGDELTIVIRDRPAEIKLSSEAALASYQTPSAIKKKWSSSRRGLEKLVRDNPGESRYLIALARHLSYREGTRREAIRQINALTQRSLGNQETQKTWRQALLSLKAKSADRALFTTYLNRFPDDKAIVERLRSLEQQESVVAQNNESEAHLAASPNLKNPGPSATLKIDSNKANAVAILRLALADEQASAFEAAATKLERAMLLDPSNPWVRLALARQYQSLGATDGADALLDNLIEINPGMPEALHARALLYSTQQKWGDALNALEKIPAAARTASMAKEQRRLWVNAQVQRALQFSNQGNSQQANTLMGQAQTAAGFDDSLLVTVAGGWSDLGQSAKGLHLMREIVSSSSMNTVATRIKYAELLLNAHQDAELSAVLKDLAASGRLNMAQQDDVNRIILGYTLRLTESLRESGRIAEAAAMINPALQRFDDNRLLLAMARIYKSEGDFASALELVERVIVREPDDISHRLLASEFALAVKELDKATGHAKAALALAPDHPRVLAAAGRVEKVRGNVAKALAYFQRSQTRESDKNAFSGVPGNLSLRLVGREPDPLSAPLSTIKPTSIDRSGLLPIPEFRPNTERVPAGAYPVPEPEAPRPPSSNKPLRQTPTSVNQASTLFSQGQQVSMWLVSARQTATQGEESSSNGELNNLHLRLATSLDIDRFALRPGWTL